MAALTCSLRLVQRAARRRSQENFSTPDPPIHHPKVILNIAQPLSVTTLPPGPSTDIQVLPSVCFAGLISTKAPIANRRPAEQDRPRQRVTERAERRPVAAQPFFGRVRWIAQVRYHRHWRAVVSRARPQQGPKTAVRLAVRHSLCASHRETRREKASLPRRW